MEISVDQCSLFNRTVPRQAFPNSQNPCLIRVPSVAPIFRLRTLRELRGEKIVSACKSRCRNLRLSVLICGSLHLSTPTHAFSPNCRDDNWSPLPAGDITEGRGQRAQASSALREPCGHCARR